MLGGCWWTLVKYQKNRLFHELYFKFQFKNFFLLKNTSQWTYIHRSLFCCCNFLFFDLTNVVAIQRFVPTDEVLRNWHQCDLRVQQALCRVDKLDPISHTWKSITGLNEIQSSPSPPLTHAKHSFCLYRCVVFKCAKNEALKSMKQKQTNDFPCNSTLTMQYYYPSGCWTNERCLVLPFTENAFTFPNKIEFRTKWKIWEKFETIRKKLKEFSIDIFIEKSSPASLIIFHKQNSQWEFSILRIHHARKKKSNRFDKPRKRSTD